MISKGLIRNIVNDEIFAEPFTSDPTGEAHSCASGSCGKCGKEVQKRLVRLGNSNNLSVKTGDIVEYKISSVHIFKGTIKVFVIPVAVFILLYYLSERIFGFSESKAILLGLAAFLASQLVNFLFRNKNKPAEIAQITEVL